MRAKTVPTPTDPVRQGEELGDLFRNVMALIRERTTSDTFAIMNEAGLTLPQMITLQTLGRCGPRSVSHIARHLSLTLATASHLVDRLVQEGLVERGEDPNDRRAKSVAISPQGKALVDRLTKARANQYAQFVVHLSPTLRRELVQVLEQVVHQLAETAASPAMVPGGANGNGRRFKELN